MIRGVLARIPPLARPLVAASALGLVCYGVYRLLSRVSDGDEWWTENPGSGSVGRAADFRESFHWGNPTERITRRSVSKRPRVAVKLGKLEGVMYRTNKRGHGMTSYMHEFEGDKPDLLMDIDNRRLHVAGGNYTVTREGIEG